MRARDVSELSRLLQLRRYAEAETSARAMLAAEPDSARVTLMLARALDGQGRHREAMSAARDACRLAPDDHASFIVLSSAAIGAREPALAQQAATAAVAARPTSPAAHYTLARAHLAASRTNDALDVAERTLELAPAWADAHNLRGMCLARLGRRSAAQGAYQRALALDPRHALALNNLSAMDVRRNPLQAVRGLTAAARIDPQAQIIHRNLAVVTHHLVLQLRWVVLGGGVLEVMLALTGVPTGVRLAVLLSFGCLLVAAVWRFARQLPRGVRRAPGRLLTGLGGRTALAFAYLAFAGFTTVAVALGSPSSRSWGTRWLLQMIVVGGIVTALPRLRR